MSSYEPLNPEQRIRTPGVPVGLRNIGNSKLKIIYLYFYKLVISIL